MFKDTLVYNDYDGNQITQDVYFNYSKMDIMRMEYNEDGKLSNFLKNIVNMAKDKEMFNKFEEFVCGAYGIKSPDGKMMVKKIDGKPVVEDFKASPAYDVFWMKMFTEENYIEKFVRSVIPEVD